MWITVMLVVIMCLTVVNMILLFDFNDSPMHNFLDRYNQQADDMAEVLRSLREVIEDMDKRLTILEQKFTLHIQSTNELKPNQIDDDELKW